MWKWISIECMFFHILSFTFYACWVLESRNLIREKHHRSNFKVENHEDMFSFVTWLTFVNLINLICYQIPKKVL